MTRFKTAVHNRIYYMKKMFGTNAGVYVYEGIVCSLGLNLVLNNNYLFLTRMGASDYQLSFIQMTPHLLNMIILIPIGIVADSLSSKKKMVMFSLAMIAVFYMAAMTAPYLGDLKIVWFIVMCSVSAGMFTMYSVSWQSFFSEAVPVSERNRTLSARQRWRMVPGMLVPVISGAVLSFLPAVESKIKAHQTFFVISAAVTVSQIFLVNKLRSGTPAPVIGISIGNLKKAASALVKNKKFLFFCGTILICYMAFQFDWTLYFIGMTRYLDMNEALIGVTVLSEALAAFLSVKFWSRLNEKYGVTLPLFFGLLLICLFPVVIVMATKMVSGARIYLFLIGYATASVGMACFWLNVFQCLLTTLANEYRTISISIFSVLTSLSNALMPLTGVALYNKFGADLRAFTIVCAIIFFFRLFAAGLWLFRWYVTEGRAAKANT